MQIPIIATLTEESLNLPVSKKDIKEKRIAVRAVIFNSENKIALFCPDNKIGYRVPGGGVESGETPEAALLREVIEELGATIELTSGPIAELIELKNKKKLEQTNLIFTARLKNILEENKKVKWLSLDEAIEELYFQIPKNYKNIFRRMRDIKTLEYIKNIGGEK
ncbi:MAG: NUDIX hydrolase [Alphaproteobacteria bacterium]|jgi:8-oxo-dGTP diphosphatase|nr:NUDIX hydrolase [Alphaproteobacteria bacterium]MBN2674960.1 NUDIX hydrolase [Alphaproteobacteria bacterium]